MTDNAFEPGGEFVLHGGRRAMMRNRGIILAIVAVVALVVLVNTFEEPKGDDSGSVGHIVIPLAIAVACIVGLFVCVGQWWEDATYFTAGDHSVGVRHGAGSMRGRTVWLDRSEPITFHGEAARGGYVLFVERDGSRVRLGDAAALAPTQTSRLDAWLRGHGAKPEHVWDRG